MATTKEIKNRIKSVKDTQKITNAMYLISSTKVRKAKKAAEATKPYFNLLKKEIRRMFAIDASISGSYFVDETPEDDKDDICGILVITADKGLAGAYNQNVIKKTQAIIPESGNYKLYVVGEYGRHYFMSHGFKVDEAFDYTANEPSLARSRAMMMYILSDFDDAAITKAIAVYTDYTNGMSEGIASTMELLPFDKGDFIAEGEEHATDASTVFEYEPNIETVLDRVVPSYLTGFIYSALVNSYCSEQTARMMAMDAANNNAQELLDALSLEYNHVRQGAITQEITEISSGARAQKLSAAKRKKKKLELEMKEEEI